MSTLVNDASVIGCTRNYAPLEQILGLRTDARSDLYALAATIYHLLTRVPPIDAAERHYAKDHGKDDPLESASTHNSAIGVGLARILTKGLALRSDDRYQTARDLRDALRNVANESASLEQEIDPGDIADVAGVAEDVELTAVPNRQLVRRCRIKFIMDGKVVHTSPEYHSGNSWSKIVAYARSKRGGATAYLPKEAAAVPQVFTENGWVDAADY